MRKASSSKRFCGSPTHLTIRRQISSSPPDRSVSRPCLSRAMAFIVKSLRARSSAASWVYSTTSGCLWSEYVPSVLYVVISMARFSDMTVTVPCFIPVSTVFSLLKTAFICSGCAEVAISQSEGFCPMAISLTQPPTISASYPAFSKACRADSTGRGTMPIKFSTLSLFIFSAFFQKQ